MLSLYLFVCFFLCFFFLPMTTNTWMTACTHIRVWFFFLVNLSKTAVNGSCVYLRPSSNVLSYGLWPRNVPFVGRISHQWATARFNCKESLPPADRITMHHFNVFVLLAALCLSKYNTYLESFCLICLFGESAEICQGKSVHNFLKLPFFEKCWSGSLPKSNHFCLLPFLTYPKNIIKIHPKIIWL